MVTLSQIMMLYRYMGIWLDGYNVIKWQWYKVIGLYSYKVIMLWRYKVRRLQGIVLYGDTGVSLMLHGYMVAWLMNFISDELDNHYN